MNWPPSFDRYGGQLPRGLVYWLSSRHRYFGWVGEFGRDAVVLECADPVDGFGAGLDGGVGVGGDFATRSYRVGGLGVAGMYAGTFLFAAMTRDCATLRRCRLLWGWSYMGSTWAWVCSLGESTTRSAPDFSQLVRRNADHGCRQSPTLCSEFSVRALGRCQPSLRFPLNCLRRVTPAFFVGDDRLDLG